MDCGHGLGICAECQSAIDALAELCGQAGLSLDIQFIVSPEGTDMPVGPAERSHD